MNVHKCDLCSLEFKCVGKIPDGEGTCKCANQVVGMSKILFYCSDACEEKAFEPSEGCQFCGGTINERFQYFRGHAVGKRCCFRCSMQAYFSKT